MSNQKCRLCLKMNPPGSRFCNFCGNDLTFSIQPDGLLPPGAVLRGSYVVENVIGEGGMGVVYSCHHKTLGTRYALKVLDPKLARIEILRQRFLAEAKIQATVRHPHIVHVLDVIDSEKDGGIPGVLAIVMEFIEGEALDQKIEESPLSERDAVSTALVVLDAIGFAHHASIVHRDLKPSNIMISAAEAKDALYRGVKVMDFGIAKLLQEQEQRTVTGAQMGTPQYMAPEQIENARDVDERTDLYAIGLTLYEMLTGRKPFQDYREFELYKAQLSMKPPSMRTFRSDISDRLEAIVMKSLEKNRANRYPNAESFQRALLSLGGYDDISLMLNPYDGTAVVQTNQKLQRKIERAIAKSNEKSAEAGNDAKQDKSKDTQSARKAAKNAVAAAEAAAKKSDPAPAPKASSKQAVASVSDRTESQFKQSAPVDPNARTMSSGKLPKVNSHKSILQISREKSKNGETPSHTFKRGHTLLKLKKSAAENAAAERESGKESLKNDSRIPEVKKSETARKTEFEQKSTDSAKSAASKKDIEQKKSEVKKSDAAKRSDEQKKLDGRRTEAGAKKDSKESRATETRNEKQKTADEKRKKSSQPNQVAAKRDSQHSPAVKKQTNRSTFALKLVVIVIVILIVAGLIYRDKQDLPAPLPTSAVDKTQSGADAQDAVIDDVSAVPLREISTDTGRMTVIPAARHWVSGGHSEELHQIELGEYAVDQVEVSFYQYSKCVEAQKCPPLSNIPEDLNQPVTNIAYGSADAFCEFAGKSLPSEDEWEAAARFGGDNNGITHVNVTCENILFAATARGECKKVSGPESVYLRTQSSNPGHLLNMLGNVREWTSTSDAKNRQNYVTKGGSYLNDRKDISISARIMSPVNKGADDLGFRCIQKK